MRSVATIAAFEGPEKKEKERLRIEREYRHCDETLKGLVEQKREELTTSAAVFTSVVARLAAIKETADGVRSTLLSAKDHLRGKQEDMRTLWLQSVELQEELKLLNAVDKVKDAPSHIRDAMDRDSYLEAANDIMQSLQVVNGNLREVRFDGVFFRVCSSVFSNSTAALISPVWLLDGRSIDRLIDWLAR